MRGRVKGVIDRSLRLGLTQHFPHLLTHLTSHSLLPSAPLSLDHNVGRELRIPNPVNDTRANMASSTASTHSKPIIIRSRTNPSQSHSRNVRPSQRSASRPRTRIPAISNASIPTSSTWSNTSRNHLTTLSTRCGGIEPSITPSTCETGTTTTSILKSNVSTGE